jgi:hypothetical protein
MPTTEEILSNKYSDIKKYQYLVEFSENYKRSLSPLLYNQKLASIYSSFGKYREAIREDHKSDVSINKVNSFNFELPKNFVIKDAIDIIDSLAGKYAVIIVNEVHHMPQTRLLTLELLPLLKKKGFTYLGLEALKNDSINLSASPKSKYLSYAEPIFGNLISNAIKLDYTLVKYERNQDDTTDREIVQANNIHKILVKDPKAKIIIHCGYSHASENTTSKKRWMASYLKELYNVDPLTIDQTINLYQGVGVFDSFLNQCASNIPIFVIQGGNSFFKIPSFNDPATSYDLQVFYSKPTYFNNRPSWLSQLAPKRKPVSVTGWVKDLKFPYLISVFSTHENKDVIPKDRFLVTGAEDIPDLYLSKGKYSMIISDYDDKPQKKIQFKVR